MWDHEAADPLQAAGRQLGDATDHLVGHLLDLDQSRGTCLQLAQRYRDFAHRASDDFPGLAAPAERLAELWGDLDAALARMSATTENLVCASGRTADAVASGLG